MSSSETPIRNPGSPLVLATGGDQTNPQSCLVRAAARGHRSLSGYICPEANGEAQL
jgi:hypothetical protein